MGAETTENSGNKIVIERGEESPALYLERHTKSALKLKNQILETLNTEMITATDQVRKDELAVDIQKVKTEAIHFEALLDALSIANQELPQGIIDKGENLNTTYEERDSNEDRDLVKEKIEPNMQEAIYVIVSALENAKYPVTISNSLAYVLNVGKDTNKTPKDIDSYAAVQDFPETYAFLQSKTQTDPPEIIDLKVNPTKNLEGNVNHGFEVSGWIKTGKNGDVLKQFSIFFQNIDPSKNPNGRVLDLGIEERHLQKFKIKGKDGKEKLANFTNLDANVIENLRSILWEFRLTDFNEYKESKRSALGVTAKFLDRFSNLMSLLKIPEEQTFDVVITLLEKEVEKNPNDKFKEVVEMIKVLKHEFDQQSAKGEGLLVSICNKNEKTKDENCNSETAFTILTGKINDRMTEVHEYSMKAKEIFESDLAPINKKKGLEVELNKVKGIYDKYASDLSALNTENARDFGAFLALRALRDQFIRQAWEEILVYHKTIETSLNN